MNQEGGGPAESKAQKDDHRLRELLAYYQYLNGEITRYRNREWINAQIFTGAIFALYGWVVSNCRWLGNRPGQSFFLAVAFIALAGGNIFYSCFAHIALAYYRTVLARLVRKDLSVVYEYYDKEQANPSMRYPMDRFPANYWRGFYSHLLPFWVTSFIAAVAGIKALPNHSYQILSFLVSGSEGALAMAGLISLIGLTFLVYEYRRVKCRANRLPLAPDDQQ